MSGEQSAFNINQLTIHLCESQTSTICKEECPVLWPSGFQRQFLLWKSQDLDCNRLYIFIQVHNESQRLIEAGEVRTHTAVFRKFEVSCDYCITCQLILNKLILWTGPRWCFYSCALLLHSHYSMHIESLNLCPTLYLFNSGIIILLSPAFTSFQTSKNSLKTTKSFHHPHDGSSPERKRALSFISSIFKTQL